MKKFLLATVALASVAMAAPANAADMPVKAAPPVAMPALYNWTGFYLGVEGGAVMGQRTEWNFVSGPVQPVTGPPVPGPLCSDAGVLFTFGRSSPGTCADVGHPLHGGFVGGEAGFNWQFGRWVFGIEGDGNWAELEEALTCAVPFQLNNCGSKIKDFETVRGRIGYAFGPGGDFLAYLTGGWATASVDVFEKELFPPFFEINSSRRHNGFTVGGGAEYGITPWLSLKGEILYVWLDGQDHCFFGRCTTSTVVPGVPTLPSGLFVAVPAHVREDFVLARMALNWRFNFGKGAPAVVARY